MKYFIGIVGLLILGFTAWISLEKQEVVDVPTQKVNYNLEITTSIYPLSYLAEKIVGENGSVVNIGENQDPHDFRPTAQDILKMKNSDLFIMQGAELEPWGEKIHEQLEKEGVKTIVIAEEIELHKTEEGHEGHHDSEKNHHDDHEEDHYDDEEHEEHTDEHHDEHESHEEEDEHDHHGHAHGEFDPHSWLDPVLMIEVAEKITEVVSEIDPKNEQSYKENLNLIKEELEILNTQYSEGLSSCSVEEVIASHDAFNYIAKRYGFEIHNIVGLSTQDLPSTVTLANLKEEAQEGVSAILLEENSIKSYGETLAKETGLKTLPINAIVYNIPEGQDWKDIMISNLESFKEALECDE